MKRPRRSLWWFAWLGLLAVAFVACGIDGRKLEVTAGTAGTAGVDSSAGSAGTLGSGGSDSAAGSSHSSGGSAGSLTGTAGTSSGTPLKLPAEACQANSECASTHCVDGVCCDGTCDGACVACNLPTSPGHCASTASGSPSPANHPACDKTASTTCGLDGMCDGAGACHKWESGTTCAGGSCDATTYKAITGAACDGKGTCVPATPVACSPFKCNGATCATTCTGDGDCVGQPCVNGSCGTVDNGNTCKTDAQCTSGHCADGYCCNSACTDSCAACDLATHQGTCTPLAAATKPHTTHPACTTGGAGACSSSCDGTHATCSFSTGAACGTCHACTAAGACQPVGDGTQDAACPQAAASCAAGGCNATGTCKAAPSGTVCADFTCTNSISGIGQYTVVDHHDKVCNGTLGTAGCKVAANVGCGGLTCANGTDCKTSCSLDVDCTNGNYCKGGVCAPWVTNGGGCTANSQCASRICLGGQCVACATQTDCLAGFGCDFATNTCVCSNCGTACSYGQDCGSSRGPDCNATTSTCDCGGNAPCAPGSICFRPNNAGASKCLAPVGMPCHAASDCAGNSPVCTNGVCAANPNNCARGEDCGGLACCIGFGSAFPSCTSSCG